MDLCCSVCAEHVDGIEVAMGRRGPALEVVWGIGGPLRPDLAAFVRVDPGGYLRIASDGLVRRFSRESKSALPLSEAIQAANILDMFFPRDRVMRFADGDLSRFRRSWTFHHTGHLDDPDPSWRYPPLMTVAGALGLGLLPAVPPAADSCSAPAPAMDDGWGRYPYGRYEGQSRHGRGKWHGADGWDVWHGRGTWGGEGWHQGRESDYDTGSDGGSRGSRRPRSPSRRPRRPREWGPDERRSDGRGGSRRRCLSSVERGGGGSAFARFFRLGLLGEVIDVEDGCLVRLHDSRGYPGCGVVTRGEWLRRYTQMLDI